MTSTTTTNSSARHSIIPSVGKAEMGGSIHGLQRDSMVVGKYWRIRGREMKSGQLFHDNDSFLEGVT